MLLNADATLEWNRRSLSLADEVRAAGDGALVESFYPSLHLNVGHAYEQLGDPARHSGALTLAFCWKFVPETKGKRLEDIQDYFQARVDKSGAASSAPAQPR